nr:MAG TPA: hypothetical protein [Caudoviricetes sp.]
MAYIIAHTVANPNSVYDSFRTYYSASTPFTCIAKVQYLSIPCKSLVYSVNQARLSKEC